MSTPLTYDEMLERSAGIQKRADIYILVGGGLIGTTVFGLVGLPFFLYGLWQIKRAEDEGLPIRPFGDDEVRFSVVLWVTSESAAKGADVSARHVAN